MCEICQNWARGVNEETRYAKLKSMDGIPLLPNHHPNCQHYNDSLMDVWKVTVGDVSCYQAHEDFCNSPIISAAATEQIKMHREVFENLQEFDGF